MSGCVDIVSTEKKKVVLSGLGECGYNKVAAAIQTGKEMIMAEFGENLKRVREDKGITQQTLAEQLYVTRQAISRWEGGSRYPDLMTAKKMAQYLEVSLDELLSDDDMKLYVENGAIMDSLVAKRAQIVMIALTLMCTLIHIIFYMVQNFVPDTIMITSTSELIKSILLVAVLGYAVYGAINDRLTPKVTMWLAVIFLGTGLVTAISCLVLEDMVFSRPYLLGAGALNIIFLVSCIRFFGGKKHISPIPIYVMTGIYSVSGLVSWLVSFSQEYPVEVYRDAVMLNIIGTLNGILLLGLLAIMAYTLDRKRKLAER